VEKDDQIIWSGTKATQDKLWTLDLDDITAMPSNTTDMESVPTTSIALPPLPTFSAANQIIRHDSNAEFVSFSHAVFGSCPITTFQHAMDHGWFGNLPKLTSKMIR
jgi:hypothetical protein